MIEVDDLTVCYGQQRVLGRLSLSIQPGEFVLVTGPSGSGKSTLLRALAGLIPHASLAHMKGRVVVDGLDTQEHSLPILAGHVGLVFQNPATQLFCLRVEEEVAFGPRNYGFLTPALLEDTLAIADLGSLRNRRIHALSGGEQQRTALASVLALRPDLLILDEPTMGQDWGHLSAFMDHVSRLNGRGMAILLITHDYELVHHYAQRVLLLRNGRIAVEGSPLPSPSLKVGGGPGWGLNGGNVK